MSALRAPVCIRAACSQSLAFGLILAHGGALALVPTLPMPGWAKAVLALAVLGSAMRSVLWHVLRRGDAITEVATDERGEWWVTTHRRGASPARLASDTVVQPWLTVLVFTLDDGRRRSLVLLPDCVEPETFRRLRVRLRYPLDAGA